MDAVSSRDYLMEVLAAATICAVNLSRLAEEIVIWCSAQFRFVTLSDSFTTGSSIMPQKRNPDAAELVRAKPGRILGAFTALSLVMKGLPLTYSKDMQEDKEPAFDAVDALALAIAAMEGMVADMTPNPDAMRQAAASGFAVATDLADWLVQSLGLPFREAHHATGRIVALAEKQGRRLDQLALADMQAIDTRITPEVFKVLSVEQSVARRRSLGGTAPANVKREAQRWLKQLKGRKP
jgi:argininosuccinate lyase